MESKIIDDITNFIFTQSKPDKADAIFLPGGTFPEVPEGGVHLYSKGYAPIIIPSGKYSVKETSFTGASEKAQKYPGPYETECDFYSDVLIRGGVPRECIIQENQALSTRDNALFTARVAENHGLKIEKAIICCKAFHARRCLMYYQMAFPETELLVYPVTSHGINRSNWYLSNEGISIVLEEVSKCGWQMKELLPLYVNSD